MFRRLIASGLPTLCAVCRCWTTQSICPDCRQVYAQAQPRCPSCALPLAPGLEQCIACAESPTDGPGCCLARVDYQWPWTEVIADFKFHGQTAWAHEMARMMLEQAGAWALLEASDGMIAIPLSRSRLTERGYNQAWELASQLHQITRVPLWKNVLVRHDTQRLQHELRRAERLEHAALAFTVVPEALASLGQRSLVLIDDVMTTGATLQAASERLMEAGAREVHSLVFARTPRPTLA